MGYELGQKSTDRNRTTEVAVRNYYVQSRRLDEWDKEGNYKASRSGAWDKQR